MSARSHSLALVLAAAALCLGCGDPSTPAAGDGPTSGTTAAVTTEAPTITPDVLVTGPPASDDLVPITTITGPSGPTMVIACDNDALHVAPTITPDGWQRFVLSAAPTDSCNSSPLLMVSFVQPPPLAPIGTFLTIITGGSGVAGLNGDPRTLTIGDQQVIAYHDAMADGTPVVSVSMTIDGVAVDAHGSVTDQELIDILGSMHRVDAATWQQLVDSIERPPTT